MKTRIAVVMVAALMAVPAFAHGRGGGFGHGGGFSGGGHVSGGGSYGGGHFGGSGGSYGYRPAPGYHAAAPVPRLEYGRSGGFRGGGEYRGSWNRGGGEFRGGYGVDRRPAYGYGFGSVRPWGGWRTTIGFSSPAWQAGRWFHGWRAGQLGWWWGVNDGWYYYPQPVYPYPVVAPTVVAPLEQAPISYYCRSLDAYYPQVEQCDEGWETFAR